MFIRMNRLERITAIHLLLQSRRKVTARQLAEKFRTSVRTIYRDVRVLEEAGVPIGAEAGLGYYLMEGYSLPPVMFTRAEAGAMLTGEKMISRLGDLSLGRDFGSAMNKVRAVLRSTDKDFVETLEQHISVHSMRPLVNTEQFPNHYIGLIQQAIVEQKVVELDYFSHYTEEVNKRNIEPIGLCYINGVWHLFAWCRLRRAVRNFRPDRIRFLRLTDETYRLAKHPPLSELIRTFHRPDEVTRIVLRLDHALARHMADMKHYLGMVSETRHDTWTEAEFLYHSVPDFARFILSWGNKVTVLEPVSLREEMKRLSTELALHYA